MFEMICLIQNAEFSLSTTGGEEESSARVATCTVSLRRPRPPPTVS